MNCTGQHRLLARERVLSLGASQVFLLTPGLAL